MYPSSLMSVRRGGRLADEFDPHQQQLQQEQLQRNSNVYYQQQHRHRMASEAFKDVPSGGPIGNTSVSRASHEGPFPPQKQQKTTQPQTVVDKFLSKWAPSPSSGTNNGTSEEASNSNFALLSNRHYQRAMNDAAEAQFGAASIASGKHAQTHHHQWADASVSSGGGKGANKQMESIGSGGGNGKRSSRGASFKTGSESGKNWTGKRSSSSVSPHSMHAETSSSLKKNGAASSSSFDRKTVSRDCDGINHEPLFPRLRSTVREEQESVFGQQRSMEERYQEIAWRQAACAANPSVDDHAQLQQELKQLQRDHISVRPAYFTNTTTTASGSGERGELRFSEDVPRSPGILRAALDGQTSAFGGASVVRSSQLGGAQSPFTLPRAIPATPGGDGGASAATLYSVGSGGAAVGSGGGGGGGKPLEEEIDDIPLSSADIAFALEEDAARQMEANRATWFVEEDEDGADEEGWKTQKIASRKTSSRATSILAASTGRASRPASGSSASGQQARGGGSAKKKGGGGGGAKAKAAAASKAVLDRLKVHKHPLPANLKRIVCALIRHADRNGAVSLKDVREVGASEPFRIPASAVEELFLILHRSVFPSLWRDTEYSASRKRTSNNNTNSNESDRRSLLASYETLQQVAGTIVNSTTPMDAATIAAAISGDKNVNLSGTARTQAFNLSVTHLLSVMSASNAYSYSYSSGENRSRRVAGGRTNDSYASAGQSSRVAGMNLGSSLYGTPASILPPGMGGIPISTGVNSAFPSSGKRVSSYGRNTATSPHQRAFTASTSGVFLDRADSDTISNQQQQMQMQQQNPLSRSTMRVGAGMNQVESSGVWAGSSVMAGASTSKHPFAGARSGRGNISVPLNADNNPDASASMHPRRSFATGSSNIFSDNPVGGAANASTATGGSSAPGMDDADESLFDGLALSVIDLSVALDEILNRPGILATASDDDDDDDAAEEISAQRQVHAWIRAVSFRVFADVGSGYIHKTSLNQLSKERFPAEQYENAVSSGMVKALNDVFAILAREEDENGIAGTSGTNGLGGGGGKKGGKGKGKGKASKASANTFSDRSMTKSAKGLPLFQSDPRATATATPISVNQLKAFSYFALGSNFGSSGSSILTITPSSGPLPKPKFTPPANGASGGSGDNGSSSSSGGAAGAAASGGGAGAATTSGGNGNISSSNDGADFLLPPPRQPMRCSHMDYQTFCRFFDYSSSVDVCAAFMRVWLPYVLLNVYHKTPFDFSPLERKNNNSSGSSGSGVDARSANSSPYTYFSVKPLTDEDRASLERRLMRVLGEPYEAGVGGGTVTPHHHPHHARGRESISDSSSSPQTTTNASVGRPSNSHLSTSYSIAGGSVNYVPLKGTDNNNSPASMSETVATTTTTTTVAGAPPTLPPSSASTGGGETNADPSESAA